MQVGVRELKKKLSSYLERAAAGESITVTDRGVPKAVLGPMPGADRLAQGMEEGWITPPSSKAACKWKPAKCDRRIQDVLDEDRGD